MLLSIIIPMYNAGKYISECLNSIIGQSLDDDYEIIVINDGSTDDGAEKVEELARKYPFIRLFDQENQGVSAARNLGLSMAKGTYIHFVDADDTLYPDSYRTLVPFAQKGLDIIYFENLSAENSLLCQASDGFRVITEGCIKDFVISHGFPVCVWLMWFRRKFLTQHHLQFSHLRIGEDAVFCMRVLQQEYGTIVYLRDDVYRYIRHAQSTVTNNDRDKLMESIENGFTLYQFYGQMSSQGNYPTVVYQRFMDAVCVLVVTHLLRGNFCYSYTRQILARMLGQGMLPLHGAGRMIGLLKVLSLYPKLLWIASFPHRYIVCKLKR